eukprot:scaffold3243_cov106-Isochrysis_galbana.AAC.12
MATRFICSSMLAFISDSASFRRRCLAAAAPRPRHSAVIGARDSNSSASASLPHGAPGPSDGGSSRHGSLK